ncbi:hypothetical protein GCM10009765_06570 [Fodinicola feengrottensis]|uniref:Integral membrane protein n=1 Tax=Fodinicola feengrottensis TaxID=435914 RepID=A0ABP4RS02_9ACTN
MIDALSLALTVTCALAGIIILGAALLKRYRWRAVLPTVIIVEAALLIQAILDLAGLLGGHHPAEPATHLAYLVTSLAVLPVAGSQVARDNGRWAATLLAVALLALAVIVVRLQTTWRPAGD